MTPQVHFITDVMMTIVNFLFIKNTVKDHMQACITLCSCKRIQLYTHACLWTSSCGVGVVNTDSLCFILEIRRTIGPAGKSEENFGVDTTAYYGV